MRHMTLTPLAVWGVLQMAPGPATFCEHYPQAPACSTSRPACTYCYSSPPTRNVFGAAIEAKLAPTAPRPLSEGDYAAALPGALAAVEALDSDGDGFSNADEIAKGS